MTESRFSRTEQWRGIATLHDKHVIDDRTAMPTRATIAWMRKGLQGFSAMESALSGHGVASG
ncbi:hypothetical protein ACNPM4_10285 [Microbacterium sp. AGC62]